MNDQVLCLYLMYHMYLMYRMYLMNDQVSCLDLLLP
jgi:hypothetical protein